MREFVWAVLRRAKVLMGVTFLVHKVLDKETYLRMSGVCI